jgi:hypothetical protein
MRTSSCFASFKQLHFDHAQEAIKAISVLECMRIEAKAVMDIF